MRLPDFKKITLLIFGLFTLVSPHTAFAAETEAESIVNSVTIKINDLLEEINTSGQLTPTPTHTEIDAEPTTMIVTATPTPTRTIQRRRLRPRISTPTPTRTPTPTPTKSLTITPTKTPTPTQTNDLLDSKQTYILNAINDYRKSKGLSLVKADKYTCSFATVRAKEIVSAFNHEGFRNRVNADSLPYPTYSRVTENLAMTGNYQNVVNMWINSTGHAANMRADTPYVCVSYSGNYYAYEGWKP